MFSNVVSVRQDGTESIDEVMKNFERLLGFSHLVTGVVAGVAGYRIKH